MAVRTRHSDDPDQDAAEGEPFCYRLRSCHTPNLPSTASWVFEPNPYNQPQACVWRARLSLDLTGAIAAPASSRSTGWSTARLHRPQAHDICEGRRINVEPIDERTGRVRGFFGGNRRFSRKLWGCGNKPNYFTTAAGLRGPSWPTAQAAAARPSRAAPTPNATV
jgi:hypothetical protein